MEKRGSKRYFVFYEAEVSVGTHSLRGIVGNISERGMFLRLRDADPAMPLLRPEGIITLRLDPVKLDLPMMKCRIVWTYELVLSLKDKRSAYHIGLEIIEPPEEWKEFFRMTAMRHFEEQMKSVQW